jgi:hypothetical protein
MTKGAHLYVKSAKHYLPLPPKQLGESGAPLEAFQVSGLNVCKASA